MATISANDLARMRQAAARERPQVDYQKARANAVFQAVEDWEVGGHTTPPAQAREAVMEAAAGVALPLALETLMWRVWALWKAGRL